MVVSRFFPNLSRRVHRAISLSASTGAVLFAETVQLPHQLLGTADRLDIPVGLVGAACYLGVNILANRLRRSGPREE